MSESVRACRSISGNMIGATSSYNTCGTSGPSLESTSTLPGVDRAEPPMVFTPRQRLAPCLPPMHPRARPTAIIPSHRSRSRTGSAPRRRPRPASRWPFLGAALLLLAGCSTVQLAYNTADFFIGGYADEYLGLDAEQRRAWSPTLRGTLARHRSEELPYLAAFFDSALTDAKRGFTREAIGCLLDQFETIYRRHFRLASAAAAPLLADLSPAQIAALAATFDEEAEEDAAEAGTEAAERRASKRAERYVDNLRWWLGELSSKQRGIVRNLTQSIPDTAPVWYAYRAEKRRQLIALLRRGAESAEIERFLVDWLVDYSDMPEELEQALPALRQAFAKLLLQLQATFDEGQRDKLLGRLERLRDDFLILQSRPRMIPVDCSADTASSGREALP